jgi:hypothetical protein
LDEDLAKLPAQARRGKLAYIRAPALDDEFGEGKTFSLTNSTSALFRNSLFAHLLSLILPFLLSFSLSFPFLSPN